MCLQFRYGQRKSRIKLHLNLLQLNSQNWRISQLLDNLIVTNSLHYHSPDNTAENSLFSKSISQNLWERNWRERERGGRAGFSTSSSCEETTEKKIRNSLSSPFEPPFLYRLLLHLQSEPLNQHQRRGSLAVSTVKGRRYCAPHEHWMKGDGVNWPNGIFYAVSWLNYVIFLFEKD